VTGKKLRRKKTMEFSLNEQIENIDKMVLQDFSLIYDLSKKMMDMLEKRKALLDEINNSR
jgi:hypothetical protein